VGRPIVLGALGSLLLAVPLLVRDPYALHIAVYTGINVMLASGLNLLVGYMGLLSLGHGAFWGLGAYASALLAVKLGVSFWLGLPAGALLAALASFLLGNLILRVRGHRFVIITIAFQEITRLVHYNWVDLTNGQNGLSGVPSPVIALPGLPEINFFAKENFYYLILAFAALTVYVCHRLARSHVGRALVAIRENENLAESVGVNTFRYSMIAFGVGAFFAGLAGSLYAHYSRYISPDVFDFIHIVEMLIMILMGGRGTIAGPVVGAIIFTALPESLRFVGLSPAAQWFTLGLILVIGILYIPEGIVPRAARLLAGRRSAPPAAATESPA
jgi:branched-chain amino acid transport system permease protein